MSQEESETNISRNTPTKTVSIEKVHAVISKLSSNKMVLFGIVFISMMVIMAIFAPYLVPYDPHEPQMNDQGEYQILQSPSLDHPMGTNHVAQDIFSQWVYGAQVSLLVALLSGIGVMVIGSTVGLLSGYYKGVTDLVIMRFVDILYGIPAIPLILLISMSYGSSVWTVIIAMLLVLWRTMARLVRSETLSLSEREFVKSARAVGASDIRIMFVHIAPMLAPLILIEGVFVMGSAVLLEASVSFLGLGATDMISWGVMLQLTFSSGAITHAWWWVIPPGLSITLFVVSLFFISRGLEDIFDP